MKVLKKKIEVSVKLINVSRENLVLKEELQRKETDLKGLVDKCEEMKGLLDEKEIEVKRLEDLANGLQKEIKNVRKELNENNYVVNGENNEDLEELKEIVRKLEGEIEAKNKEKIEILKKKEEEFKELKKANEALMDNNTKLQQNLLGYSKEFVGERTGLKEDLKKLEEHRENLKKELNRKEAKINELEEIVKNLQMKYVKTKEDVADIINLIFEKGGTELMEDIEGFMLNLNEISKEFEGKAMEKFSGKIKE